MPKNGKRDLVKERFWRKTIERFRSSGKTRAKFCADEGLSTDLLIYWTRVIGERDAELVGKTSETAPEMFVPMVVADSGHSNLHSGGGRQQAIAEVLFSEGSILLFSGVDSSMLKALFQALREVGQ